MAKKLKIGLVGLGTVGQGLLKLIEEKKADVEVVAVCDRSYKKKSDKLGNIPAGDDVNELLKRDDLDAIVELTGGIDFPLYVAREAIDKKIPLVTANKALLAEHGYTLLNKAQETKTPVRFEAAVAGAIPIIHNLLYAFRSDTITSCEGILNGTSNYILTCMRREKSSYENILQKAQQMGLAEADPALDVSGIDATHKLAIIASIISGTWVEFQRIQTRGIDTLSLSDIYWADRMKFRIRLVGKYMVQEGKHFLSVEPTMIDSNHFLWDVEYENNAVLVNGKHSGSHMLVGKGAGALPTAFSVLNDIKSLKNVDPASINGFSPSFRWQYARVTPQHEITSPFYLRLPVQDETGVLAQIASILGENSISIASVQQDQREKVDGHVDLVIVTHTCKRANLAQAISTIEALDNVVGQAVFLPIDQ